MYRCGECTLIRHLFGNSCGILVKVISRKRCKSSSLSDHAKPQCYVLSRLCNLSDLGMLMYTYISTWNISRADPITPYVVIKSSRDSSFSVNNVSVQSSELDGSWRRDVINIARKRDSARPSPRNGLSLQCIGRGGKGLSEILSLPPYLSLQSQFYFIGKKERKRERERERERDLNAA